MNTLLHTSSLAFVDNLLFTLTVLTSDSVMFSVGISKPLKNNYQSAITDLYVLSESHLERKPTMGFLFTPPLSPFPIGEILIDTLNDISDYVPFFGGMASDYSTSFKNPLVIFGGEAYADRIALLLLEGNFTPKFQIFQGDDYGSILRRAIVTESKGNTIMRVNDMPVLDFLDTLGLCWEGQITGIHSIPVYLDRNDGKPPVVRGIRGQTEEGNIILAGKAPVDSILSFGLLDRESVLNSAKKAGQWMELNRPKFSFIYSCISRNFSLGLDYTAEIDFLKKELISVSNYLFAYTSAEFCPLMLSKGKWHNEYHNMSLITASF
jgi:hypothetical protein